MKTHLKEINNNEVSKADFYFEVEVTERKTEVIEEFLYVNDDDNNNSLIRMEMNIIEFPTFTKNPRVKKDQALKYYYSKDKTSFLEVVPPMGESIPGEFEERVFISLLSLMKKKGGSPLFYCTSTEIIDGLNVSTNNKNFLYSKIKPSIAKLSKTNYSFQNLFYKGTFNGKVDDLIMTSLISSRVVTFKEADEKEKTFFRDKRVKEVYRIRIADDIYGNITNKGYLVFDADVLLSITDSIVRSLYTQITKWRNNGLYLRKSLEFIAKRIPLSLKGSMVYNTVEKIKNSFEVLKNEGLITDFNYIRGKKIENGEFEIFFSSEHNKVKQQLFYDEKASVDYIHYVEERFNEVDNEDVHVKEILEIFGEKGAKLVTLPKIISDSLNMYDFDYVKYTAEYTVLFSKVSLAKYFKDALAGHWADEYISKKEIKKVIPSPKVQQTEIEEAIIVNKYTWEDFLKFPEQKQEEVIENVYSEYLEAAGIKNSKTSRNIFEKAKKTFVLEWLTKHDYVVDNPVGEITPTEVIEKVENPEENTRIYESFTEFFMELFPLVQKNKPDYPMKTFNDVLLMLGMYEDKWVKAVIKPLSDERVEGTIIIKNK